jgi:hypothetical protein
MGLLMNYEDPKLIETGQCQRSNGGFGSQRIRAGCSASTFAIYAPGIINWLMIVISTGLGLEDLETTKVTIVRYANDRTFFPSNDELMKHGIFLFENIYVEHEDDRLGGYGVFISFDHALVRDVNLDITYAYFVKLS